jgi:hypothetical protein
VEVELEIVIHAMRDLRNGVAAGRFHVANPQLALRASGGALTAVMHALLRGELGRHADSEHAEGVLRSFGLDSGEAEEIAHRLLPDEAHARGQDTAG